MHKILCDIKFVYLLIYYIYIQLFTYASKLYETPMIFCYEPQFNTTSKSCLLMKNLAQNKKTIAS